jgi:hypothetical protein
MDGLDEDYCETLEFNECEDDEYRCANGMCIPEEYWLDGDYDCMDWTDETYTTIHSGFNCFRLPSIACDEHLCAYSQWSCGDGKFSFLSDVNKQLITNIFIGECASHEIDRFEGAGFSIAGVPSRSKMYRTSADSDLHSVLHFARKNKVYAVHFAKKNYTLVLST